MAAKAFVTSVRVREFDTAIKKLIEDNEGSWAAEQAVIVHSLLDSRLYIDGVCQISIPSPERVVEGLVSLLGDKKFK
jgi:hypothetical protein